MFGALLNLAAHEGLVYEGTIVIAKHAKLKFLLPRLRQSDAIKASTISAGIKAISKVLPQLVVIRSEEEREEVDDAPVATLYKKKRL